MHLGNDKQVEVTRALSTGEDSTANVSCTQAPVLLVQLPLMANSAMAPGEREGFVQDHRTVVEAGLWPTSPSPLGIPIFHRGLCYLWPQIFPCSSF